MFYPNSIESSANGQTFFMSTGNNSPESVLTDITNQSRGNSPSALTSVHRGPLLLPKIRCQDRTTEPTAGPVRHQRHASSSAAYHHFAPYPYGIVRPGVSRQRTRSPEGRTTASPASAVPHGTFTSSTTSPTSTHTAATAFSTYSFPPAAAAKTSPLIEGIESSFAVQAYHGGGDHSIDFTGEHSVLNSPIAFSHPQSRINAPARRTSLAHARTTSLPPGPRGHSRSVSASSVDRDTLLRHGYPTQYRQIPQYVTAAQHSCAPDVTAAPPMQISHSAGPAFMMNDFTAPYDETNISLTFPQETTSLLSYLSAPNPTPGLITRSVSGDFHRKNRDWWWWDVRTLRSWTDFNIDSILAVQDFERLLEFPQDVASLPSPPRITAAPDTEHQLRDSFQRFFATKVNAALKATLGDKHIFMHAQTSASNSVWPKPDFISNYASDYMKTYHDETRGRVVGLVKPYSVWNTGLRCGDQIQRVQYLHGLAHLHRVMREHRCRYGFIITEIELLCVRMGAKDEEYTSQTTKNANTAQDEGPTPYFGYLETAPAIQLSTTGIDPATSKPSLTVAIALWYLHMLAKEEPLQGQPGWKLHVGGPAERTRQFKMERDSWMPKAQDSERRCAKNVRGWVWPEDPFHKKENLKKERRR